MKDEVIEVLNKIFPKEPRENEHKFTQAYLAKIALKRPQN